MSSGMGAVDAIAAALRRWDFVTEGRPDFSVGSGLAGYVLFLSEYAVFSGDTEARQDACAGAARLADAIANFPVPVGLLSGLTGIATTIFEVARLFPEEFSLCDAGAIIDEAVADVLDVPEWVLQLDVVSGIVGVGVYALARLETAEPSLRKIIGVLSETAEHSRDGVAWFQPTRLMSHEEKLVAPEGQYVLGLAHGTAGILSFLCDCAAAGMLPADSDLIEGAVHWLLHHDISRLEAPYAIRSGLPSPPARTAWCHGNPGIATALLKAGLLTGDETLVTNAVTFALQAASRSLEESAVLDGGFCHGAAGIAFMLDAAAQATDNASLADAADHWTGVLLDYRQPEGGLAGFSAHDSSLKTESKFAAEAGLLRGAAGIGAVLMARMRQPATSWPSLFLQDFSRYPCR